MVVTISLVLLGNAFKLLRIESVPFVTLRRNTNAVEEYVGWITNDGYIYALLRVRIILLIPLAGWNRDAGSERCIVVRARITLLL